jgi:hypothetical protein
MQVTVGLKHMASTEKGLEDQHSARYPRYKKILAKDRPQSRNDGLSAEDNSQP